MNDRDFARAHDRYLEPPDEALGAESMTDENYAYERDQQRRIDDIEYDVDQYRARKVVIGSALPDSEKIQHFANRDPAPDLPFPEEVETYAIGYWIIYAVLVLAVCAFFAFGPLEG